MVVAAVVLVAACGANGGAATTTLTASASGTTVQTSVGEHLLISLEANPTTGYLWQVQSGLDTAVVSFVGQDYQEGPAASGVVGAGGTDTLEFLAAGAGTTTIDLAYARAGGAPASTFSVTVEVK
jgi:inhibitor of cysteine peptidase